MTAEQQIRGPDAAVTWVLLVTGYSSDSVPSASRNELRQEVFEEHGASPNLSAGVYRLQFLLTNKEVPGRRMPMEVQKALTSSLRHMRPKKSCEVTRGPDNMFRHRLS
jgi:hypothetical protein